MQRVWGYLLLLVALHLEAQVDMLARQWEGSLGELMEEPQAGWQARQ